MNKIKKYYHRFLCILNTQIITDISKCTYKVKIIKNITTCIFKIITNKTDNYTGLYVNILILSNFLL